MNSFYSREELSKLGFKSVGKNVYISKKASFYSEEKIEIGDNVRIDDFCILSGKININNNIHIAAFSGLYGGDAGITIGDFANISSNNMIYAISDDYSGEYMTNPLIPDHFKKVEINPVYIEEHVIVGSGCVILPGVKLREGSAFGALSLIKDTSDAWSINAGIPAKKIKNRSKNLLKLEKIYKEVH